MKPEDPRLVIVIPTLNEEAALPGTLAAIQNNLNRHRPIVVADCGSMDRTTAIARQAGCYVVTGPTLDGRGAALDAGVRFALDTFPEAEAIWMLHADTHPFGDADLTILDTLAAESETVGGAFSQRFATTGVTPWQRRQLHFVCMCNRLRYRMSGVYFGDQGIFMRPRVLKEIGGVPHLQLFEDVELCRSARELGTLRLIPKRLTTSPRRFLKNGIVRQVIDDWKLVIRHRYKRNDQYIIDAYNASGR